MAPEIAQGAQEKVLTNTMIMMATSAATGTCATQGRSGTITISRKTPATSVERRPLPPSSNTKIH